MTRTGSRGWRMPPSGHPGNTLNQRPSKSHQYSQPLPPFNQSSRLNLLYLQVRNFVLVFGTGLSVFGVYHWAVLYNSDCNFKHLVRTQHAKKIPKNTPSVKWLFSIWKLYCWLVLVEVYEDTSLRVTNGVMHLIPLYLQKWGIHAYFY